MGLLLLSKYTGVFLLAGIVIWLSASAQMRPWLKRREPYLAGLIALVLFSPVILWNAEHHWASFAKQFGHALDLSDGGLGNVGTFVGIQALFVSPLIFAFGYRRSCRRDLARIFPAASELAVAGLPPRRRCWLISWSTRSRRKCCRNGRAPLMRSPSLPRSPPSRRAEDAPERGPLFRSGFAAAPWTGLVFTLAMFAQMTLPAGAGCRRARSARHFRRLGAAGMRTRARWRGAHHAGYIANAEYDTNAELAFYLRDIAGISDLGDDPLRLSAAGRSNAAGAYHRDLRGVGAVRPISPELQKHFESVEADRDGLAHARRRSDQGLPHLELKGYRGGVPY